MKVKIITDSTSEISQKQAASLDISIVPIKSIFGDREYREGIDMMPEAFYQKLEMSDELPTTSQPSPGDFEKVFRQSLAEGDQIVAITISSKLSGTWQSAAIAKEAIGVSDGADNIYLVDSESATVGLNILMQRAIEMRDAGKTAKEIAQAIEVLKKEIQIFAVVDTLEYLHKGGRLSAAAKTAGTLLKVKPIITVTDGEIKVVAKSRGLKKAYDEIYNLIAAAGGIDFDQPFALGYTGKKDRFNDFAEMSKTHLEGHDYEVVSIGCAIGTHVGPGAVAIAFFVK